MLKAGDKIIFPVGSKELVYRVTRDEDFLTHDDGSNAAIFKELGIKNPKAFCSKVYGYETDSGSFPICKKNDTEALQRVVDALLDECKKYNSSHPLPQQFQVGDKVRIKERKFDQVDYRETFVEEMAKLSGQIFTVEGISSSFSYTCNGLVPDDRKRYSLTGLGWNWTSGMLEKVSEAECSKKDILKEGDHVTFKVGDETLKYRIYPKYAYYKCLNDKIFDLLGLDKMSFCSKHYGYEAGTGDWPECKECDYEALTRTVNALQEECYRYNLSHTEKKEPSHDAECSRKVDDFDELRKTSIMSVDCGLDGGYQSVMESMKVQDRNPVDMYPTPIIKIGQIQSQEKEVKLTIKKTKYRF